AISSKLVSKFFCKKRALTRVFHLDHLRKPRSQMDTALSLKSSSGSRSSYSRRQPSLLALPHQPSRPPRHDQYEISRLMLTFKKGFIFHF
ncbi:MAG: hypothetical protein K9M81_01485, partial [Chthoniobacterales bacterium]|nr:hypothetical protein [Chthoniobacterales bacterium]